MVLIKIMLFQLYGYTTELRKYIVQAKETMWVCIASIQMFQFSVYLFNGGAYETHDLLLLTGPMLTEH